MGFAVHPYAAAAAGLIAGGLVMAPAPVAAPLPDLAVRDIQLTGSDATGFLADVFTQQLGGASALINSMVNVNHTLGGFADDLLSNVFSDQANPVVFGLSEGSEQLIDSGYGLLGMGQTALLDLLGANGTVDSTGAFTATDLLELNKSVVVAQDDSGSYPFGGLESVLGHYFGGISFISAALTGMSGTGLEGSAVGSVFDTLVGDAAKFNTALVESELAFNHNLVSFELAQENDLFGSDSALNGTINRAFNTFNMLFDSPEKMFNSISGATGYDVDYAKVLQLVAEYGEHTDISSALHLIASPQDLTSSLLTGSSAQVFNGGEIGGLTGMVDQSSAMWADLFGLQGSDFAGLLNHADLGALDTSVLDFFQGLSHVLTPFGDLFSI